jgi:hypothetical protein
MKPEFERQFDAFEAEIGSPAIWPSSSFPKFESYQAA